MPEIIINTTNLSMPRRLAVAGSPAAHRDFLQATGYRPGHEVNDRYTGGGFEWSEVRNPHNLRLMGRGALALMRSGDITRMHQSWMTTTRANVLAAAADTDFKRVLKQLLLMGTIPPLVGSLDRIVALQTAANVRLPVIAHPNQQQPPSKPGQEVDYRQYTDAFAQLAYQLSPELAAAWGALYTNVPRMVDTIAQRQTDAGFTNPIWDTRWGHGQRSGYSFSDPYYLINNLVRRGMMDEMQLNLTDDPDSLRLALNGNLEQTHHGRALRTALGALATTATFTINTSATAKDFANIGQQPVEGHRQLIQSVSTLIK